MTQSATLGDVPDGIGLAIRSGINLSDVALATQNEGAAPPVQTYPHMLWLDDTAGKLYRRDAGNVQWLILESYRATVAPTVNDDMTDGWVIGAKWADATHKRVYICRDNAVGAAVWTEVSVGGVSGVTAVNGETGDVTVTAAKVGLGNVTNALQVAAALGYSLKASPANGDRVLIRDQVDGEPKMVDWSALPSGGGGGVSTIVQDEGVDVVSSSPRINFVGPGVKAEPGADGRVDVTIPGAAGAVTSLNGETGDINLDPSWVGLGNVTNDEQVVAALDYTEKALPAAGDKILILDQDTTAPKVVDWASLPTASLTLASQAEAEAGVENTKYMTPLRTAQAIAVQAGGGGGAAGTTIEIWDTDGASGATDERVVIRGAATRYRLPSANAAAPKEILVLNRAAGQVEVQAAQSIDIVNGSVYPDDLTNYNVRHALAGHSALGLTNKITIEGWFRVGAGGNQYMLFSTAASDTSSIYIRTAGNYSGSFATLYLMVYAHDGAAIKVDQRVAITPSVLTHFAVSIDLSVPSCKIAINGALATPLAGGTLLTGTIAGTAPRIGSGFVAGLRRSWYGLAAGLQVWPTYIDLGLAKNRALFYDGGPTKRGGKIGAVSPVLVFNGSGTSVANGGSAGGTWTNATPAGTTAPTTGDYPGLMESIEGGGSVILPVGRGQSFMRSAAGGLLRVI